MRKRLNRRVGTTIIKGGEYVYKRRSSKKSLEIWSQGAGETDGHS